MSRPLTILYIGNVGPRAHATYTTENHVMRDAQALGHTVIPLMEGPTCHAVARMTVRKHPVDLVLYTRTEGLRWPHEAAIDLWDECRRAGVPTASLHLDAFFGLHRRGVTVTRQNALFAVDLAATADGDHGADFAAAGIAHLFLPPAVVSDECGVGTSRAEYQGDAAFVGSSRGYHNEWPRRRELVAALESRYGDRLTRAGDGVTVREAALNDLYASVPVVAGDSLAPLHEASRYGSDRITETAGRGGVLVHPLMDWWADELGDAVVWSGWGVGEQIEKMDEVRSWTPERRSAHRDRAVEIVKGGHTYRHRVAALLDAVGL